MLVGRNNEHAPFRRDVWLGCQLAVWLDARGQNVDLRPLRVGCLAREWRVLLPARQGAQGPQGRIAGCQSAAISLGPISSLTLRPKELGVLANHVAGCVDLGEGAVQTCPASLLIALTHFNHLVYARTRRCAASYGTDAEFLSSTTIVNLGCRE